MPGTIRSALKGERPVVRSDGTYIRDYFYVKDGAAAYMQLAEALHGNAFAPRRGVQLLQRLLQVDVLALTRKILERMDSTLEPDVRGEAKHEIAHQWLSAAKARRVLHWAPRFTLDDGLDRTIAWYREFLARD